MNSKRSFNRLFLLNEGLAIAGKRFVNFFAVFLILLVTFFCVGFAEGSKNYLTKKMDDPYNKWICFDKNSDMKSNELEKLISSLRQDSIIDKFHLNNTSIHNYEYIDFLSLQNENSSSSRGLELSNKMDLLNTVLDSNNINIDNIYLLQFLKSNFDNSHGIIITHKMLERHGFKIDSVPSFLKFKLIDTQYNNQEFTISVPLLAIVKELPLSVDFICNKYTLTFLLRPASYKRILFDQYRFIDLKNIDSLIFCSEVDKQREFSNFFNEMDFKKLPDSLFWESNFHNLNYYSLRPLKGDSLSIYEVNDRLKKIEGQNYICKDYLFLENTREYYKKMAVNFISVQLKELNNISDFKDYLESYPIENKFHMAKEEELIKINISGIKNKENLNFISQLTYLLTYSLLFFSVFSLILFISSVISSHFEKIKRNIGTLKAFGLSNSILIKNYIIIFFTIIFTSSILSFLIALSLGEMGLASLIFKYLSIPIDNDNCFSLWSSFGFISFVIVNFSTFLIIILRLKNILNHTPGDLIFER